MKYSQNIEELSSVFQLLGITRTEMRIILKLMEKKEMSARDIERDLDLQQPYVSIETQKLFKRGWIRERTVRVSSNRGRPQKFYTIVVSPDTIERELLEKIKENEEKMTKLKRIISEVNK